MWWFKRDTKKPTIPQKTPYDLAMERLQNTRAEVERLQKEHQELQRAYDDLKRQYETVVTLFQWQTQNAKAMREALEQAVSLIKDVTIKPNNMQNAKALQKRKPEVLREAFAALADEEGSVDRPLLEGELNEQGDRD